MTAAENRALGRTALVLVVASVVRLGMELGRGAAEPMAGEDVLPALAAAVDSATEAEARRGRPLGEGETIDPNVAPEEELDRLPGVGPATAAAVVAAREAEGPFRSADDLLRVRGIGPATLDRFRDRLSIAPGGRPARRPARAGRVPAGGAGAVVGAGRVGRPSPIPLNRATAEELEALPGVGPALAARIVERRRTAGAFRSVDELTEVRGIGPVLVERLRPLVTLR